MGTFVSNARILSIHVMYMYVFSCTYFRVYICTTYRYTVLPRFHHRDDAGAPSRILEVLGYWGISLKPYHLLVRVEI